MFGKNLERGKILAQLHSLAHLALFSHSLDVTPSHQFGTPDRLLATKNSHLLSLSRKPAFCNRWSTTSSLFKCSSSFFASHQDVI